MGANSSDDHEQQLVVGRADNNIDHDHQQQQSLQHVVINSIIRFKCSFCGRGFSNAQALGGHMNVHRRDRAAKFNNNSSSSSDSTHHHHDHHESELLPWNIISPRQDLDHQEEEKEDDDHDDDIRVIRQEYYHNRQQLPLFIDTVVPSRLISKGDDVDDHRSEDHDQVIITKRQLIIHQSSSSHGDLTADDDRKLDLELRLGPDPE